MKMICSNLFKKAGIDDIKDVRGRSSNYRTNETPQDVLDKKLDRGMSGELDEDKSDKLNDIWLDALKRQKVREKEQEPVFAFVTAAKKEKEK